MRAVQVRELDSFDRAELADVPDPRPGAGEVVVEIHAAPVNYVDYLTFSGKYQFRPELPYTPGKGPAGIVRTVGADVSGVAPGDRVLAMTERGGYAELVAADSRDVYPLPDGLSFVEAASMSLAFDTSWIALRERARIKPGESVLALGATGAVGGATIQLAKAMGAGTVLAGVSSPDRLDPLVSRLADGMVDLSTGDLRESIRNDVFAATGGDGVDIVIDPLGGDAFDGAIRALVWRGRLVVVGFAAGRIPTLEVNYLLLKNIEVSGMQISDYRTRTPGLLRECYRDVFEHYEAGRIRAPTATALPLTEWQTALRMIGAREAPGRLVLLPQQ